MEADAGRDLADFGFKPQRSYLEGRAVKYGTPNSSRPDFASEGYRLSVDTKDYNVSTPQGRHRLVEDIVEQTGPRAATYRPA